MQADPSAALRRSIDDKQPPSYEELVDDLSERRGLLLETRLTGDASMYRDLLDNSTGSSTTFPLSHQISRSAQEAQVNTESFDAVITAQSPDFSARRKQSCSRSATASSCQRAVHAAIGLGWPGSETVCSRRTDNTPGRVPLNMNLIAQKIHFLEWIVRSAERERLMSAMSLRNIQLEI